MSNKNEIIRTLRSTVTTLQNQVEQTKPAALNNSLTSLVQSAVMQSRLNSISPIIDNNVYYPVTLNYTMLMYMYKTHGIIQTAIDMPVLDAFRGGLEFTSSELDPEDLEDFCDWLEEKGVLQSFGNAVIWKRLFGGAALVINAGQDPTKPLDLFKLDKDHLEFYDACRWELMAKDPANPSMGSQSMLSQKYDIYGVEMDASRVLTMSGKRAPFLIRNQLAGWGMSEVERMIADFNLFLQTRNVLYEILDEAKLDIYHLSGYSDSLATADGTALINQRVELTNQLKNFQKALILDKEDDYDQKQLSFSGLSEIMKENRIGIASALRMPITKLFGLSASGFNSGEDDIENYNAMVESEVREPARPALNSVIKLCARAFFGDDYSLKYKFKPLRMMTSTDEETIKSSKQQRLTDLYDRGLVDSKEVGEVLHKEDLIGIATKAQKGELEEHPLVPALGAGGPGAEGGDGGDTGASAWQRSPKSGNLRRKLKSGRFEYKKK
jgi:phage-related protein (TIGR01555 family)